MIVEDDVKSLQTLISQWKAEGLCVGFVPTMGALHAGHLSLVDLAKSHADKTVVSIYVNPTQFAPGEDFEAYPRDVDADLAALKATGADLVFMPRTSDLYPSGPEIRVRPGQNAKGLESNFRPHFFDGVCTIVHHFFEIVKPDVSIFGEKDYQQLMVIREMVEMHDLGVEIIGGETGRDEYGLALSSRNAYLSAEELAVARKLNQVLKRAGRGGLPRQANNALLAMTDALLDAGFDKVDYVEERWGRILAAAWVGKTRLIDNIAV